MILNVSWSEEKNQWLIKNRGFGFQDIVSLLESDGFLGDIENPSPNYPNQRILYVAMEGYVVSVPYIETEDGIFLKTAFRDRKATKRHMKDG